MKIFLFSPFFILIVSYCTTSNSPTPSSSLPLMLLVAQVHPFPCVPIFPDAPQFPPLPATNKSIPSPVSLFSLTHPNSPHYRPRTSLSPETRVHPPFHCVPNFPCTSQFPPLPATLVSLMRVHVSSNPSSVSLIILVPPISPPSFPQCSFLLTRFR